MAHLSPGDPPPGFTDGEPQGTDGGETGAGSTLPRRISETSSEIQLHMEQRRVPQAAEMLAKMEVLNPEVVRVTPAFRAFQQCALALRDSDVDLYFKSRKSQKISTFWSHSWHGSHWKKILNLITIYNGPIAIVFGMFIATVMMILFALELLPGIDRGKEFSYWCSLSGFVATALVMIFWRPQKQIFLDRICISQTDRTLKAQAIKSLAGLLKESDSMLILWDPTWTERLWCLFELAAFLQSKKGQQKELIVRPTFLGPMQVALFLLAAALTPCSWHRFRMA